MIRQYTANQISLPFFTMFIITLQANKPDKKAATKPAIKAVDDMPDASGANSPFIKLKNDCPKIGIKTIKKENFAISSLLFPSNNPVEIVVPDRDKPGKTAID